MRKCWCGNQSLEEYSDNYYVCRLCGTLITKQEISETISCVNDENNDLYGSNYWNERMLRLSGEENIDELIQRYLGERVLYWLGYILEYIPIDSSIAEVGCGLGQLAYMMKCVGYQQKAYEISPVICNMLKNKMGLDVVCAEFGQINEIYEAILSFDLLEHLVDPVSFVSECKDRLWGRKIFCCQTPCYTEEWTYEEMLVNKPSFKELLVPEQHIYIFSKRSITKLLNSVGFNYINFEKPAFGEGYDMFLFASSNPIIKISKNEVEQQLYNVQYGRIIKVLLDFFNRLNNV